MVLTCAGWCTVGGTGPVTLSLVSSEQTLSFSIVGQTAPTLKKAKKEVNKWIALI